MPILPTARDSRADQARFAQVFGGLQLFHGAGVMLARSSTTPGEIVRTFVDYAGTTAEGLRTFEASTLAEDIGRGIDAAYRKARIDLTRLGAAEESRSR